MLKEKLIGEQDFQKAKNTSAGGDHWTPTATKEEIDAHTAHMRHRKSIKTSIKISGNNVHGDVISGNAGDIKIDKSQKNLGTN